ncbi:alpha/beta fold hydrolase [Allosediminivita pacifica]|uniref:Pimeloyl-ACP methyl ester carboxylesterase n=1 Tax=Allosediminivita pacifica TaxID=1267769 RepID=A0A2T6AXA7_9RHOB|nr:alpha/beta hydrolase [Allosediminivita pacifica]PTX48454.1 pimeloyl-ACP methyl ester carboxylesterase [Allosediminivita pacifica]GGB10400.1 3-oxoadipate enol-lactonase [Allosediminivita pacifica]
MLHKVELGSREGPPLVFLHGAGYDCRMWAEVAAQLNDCRCTAIDLPGHGQSRATDLEDFDAAADEVAECIRAHHDGAVTLVGLSLGAYVGFRCLARHPDLANRAVLSGLQDRPVMMGPAMRLAMRATSALMSFRSLRERSASDMGFMNLAVASDAHGRPNASIRTMWRAARCALEFDAREELCHVRTPTLFLAGEKGTSRHPECPHRLSRRHSRLRGPHRAGLWLRLGRRGPGALCPGDHLLAHGTQSAAPPAATSCYHGHLTAARGHEGSRRSPRISIRLRR